MILHRKSLYRYLTAALFGLSVSVPISLQAAPRDVVLLWGSQTSGEMMMDFGDMGAAAGNLDPEQACELARSFVDMNLPMLPAEVDRVVRDLTFEMGASEQASAAAAALRDPNLCATRPDPGYSGDFYLIFTSCTMIMGAGTQWMRWTVPPYSNEASMIALDSADGRAVSVPLETRMGQLQEANVTGEAIQYSMSGPGESKAVMLGVPRLREFDAERYDFSYSGNINVVPEGMGAAAAFMPSITVSGEGHSWIVPDAPGVDVITAFYTNFKNHVVPAAGVGSLMSAMVRQMSDIATKGIPVETTQTSKVGGGSMAAGGFDGNSTSTSTIKRLMLLEGKASGVCAPTVVPEGIELVSVDQMMQEAMGGSGAGGQNMPAAQGMPAMSDDQAAQMQEAMSGMQEAMKQLTPEQQEMMRNMGIPIPGQATAANPAGAPAAASSRRSSADLTTGNLTQTAQLHLQELGYDVGNTDGTASLETTIAISQFQAEKGMKVTGEVTPQLIGILAAEVDRR